MNKLILLVGVPACGKSTYAKTICDENSVILSSDALRKELLSSEQNQNKNSLVFETLYSRARRFLLENKNVIIDATNINKFERKRVLDNFIDFNIKRIAISISSPKETCVKRDLKRERTVGEDIIEYYLNRYEKPTKDEGFDEIIFINNENQPKN